MKPQVFISYKSEEYSYADKVRSALQQSGVPCWMAPESIRGGASYAQAIPSAIRECQVFVLILTEKSQESQWVKREIDRAINERKRVLPFMPEPMEFNDDITFYLTNVQQYFAYRDWDRELNRMIDEICAELGIERIIPEPAAPEPAAEPTAEAAAPASEKPAPVKKPQPPKQPKAKPSKRKMTPIIAVCIAAVLAIAVIAGILIANLAGGVVICGEKVSQDARELSLTDAKVTSADITALNGLTGLSELSLVNCSFGEGSDPSAIDATRLTSLTLSGCSLSDSQFEKLNIRGASLQSLDVSNNQISDITMLAKLKSPDSLTTLNLSKNKISDLSAAGSLRQLRELSVGDNQLTSLSGLETCLYLERVIAPRNELDDIDGLANATLLTTADLSGNKLYSEDLQALTASAEHLTNLYLSENNLADVTTLGGLKELEYLDVSDNAIEDISPLAKKKHLIGLDASGNAITEVMGFATMFLTTINDTASDDTDTEFHLEYLDLSDNKITRFFASSELPLQVLDLSGNPLSEGLNLYVKDTIDYVNLHGCTVSTADMAMIKTFNNLIVDFNESLMEGDILTRSLGDVVTVNERIILIDWPPANQVAINEALGGKAEFMTSAEFSRSNDMSAESVSKLEHTVDLIRWTTGAEIPAAAE